MQTSPQAVTDFGLAAWLAIRIAARLQGNVKGSTEQQEADICHWVFVTGAISRQMSMTRCAA